MGVWIETSYFLNLYIAVFVTPFVGVWIETLYDVDSIFGSHVTPFVGVWIETIYWGLFQALATSHPSWVCGLKLPDR